MGGGRPRAHMWSNSTWMFLLPLYPCPVSSLLQTCPRLIAWPSAKPSCPWCPFVSMSLHAFGRVPRGPGAILRSGPCMGPDELPGTILYLWASNCAVLPLLSSFDPPSSLSIELLPWPSLWPGSLLAIGGLPMLSLSPLGDPSKVQLVSIWPVLPGSALRLRACFWLDWVLAGTHSSFSNSANLVSSFCFRSSLSTNSSTRSSCWSIYFVNVSVSPVLSSHLPSSQPDTAVTSITVSFTI